MSILKDILAAVGHTVYFVSYACAAGMIVHCFYNEAVRITRTKLLIICCIEFAAGLISQITVGNLSDFPAMVEIEYFVPCIVIAAGGGKSFLSSIAAFLRVAVAQFLVLIATSSCLGRLIHMFVLNDEFVDKAGQSIPGEIFWSIIPLIISVFLYIGCIRRGGVMYFRGIEKLMVAIYFVAIIVSGIVVDDEGAQRMLDFFVFLLLILAPVLIYKNRLSAYYSEQSAHNESFLEAELAASRQYREAQEETRAFRHDIKNELTMLSVLMREKRFEEAEQSLGDMLGKVSELSPRIVTGDDMLDSLISSKLHDLEQRHIEVTVKGVLEGGLDWKPIDICSVFANAIDNAAESCMKLPQGTKRYIHINFRKTEMQRVITIKNPTATDVDAEALNSGRYNTSKPDKAHHGFGVRNIRKTAEKYGGMLNFACENKEFTLTIVLMK